MHYTYRLYIIKQIIISIFFIVMKYQVHGESYSNFMSLIGINLADWYDSNIGSDNSNDIRIRYFEFYAGNERISCII